MLGAGNQTQVLGNKSALNGQASFPLLIFLQRKNYFEILSFRSIQCIDELSKAELGLTPGLHHTAFAPH